MAEDRGVSYQRGTKCALSLICLSFPPSGLKKKKKKVDNTDLAEKAILNAPREYSRLLPFWTSNSKVNFNALRTVQAEGAVEDKVYKKKAWEEKIDLESELWCKSDNILWMLWPKTCKATDWPGRCSCSSWKWSFWETEQPLYKQVENN